MSDTTQKPEDDEPEAEVKHDDAVEDTFPASDPLSTGGSTGPNDPVPPPLPNSF